MAKQSIPGQSKFSINPRQEYKCSCGDTFYYKSRLNQHARFCQKKTPEEDQEYLSASEAQGTTNTSAVPIGFTEPNNEQQQKEGEADDPITVLVQKFYNRYGSEVSQAFMTDLTKLLQDAIDAKAEYPDAYVPTPSEFFSYVNSQRTKN